MAYCTQANLKEEVSEPVLIELTDDEGTGAVNAGRVIQAITDADAEIDSYLAQRYAVPMTVGLALLKDISKNLSLERLYLRRSGALPEDRKTRIDAVRKLLSDIAMGKASLGVTPEPPVDSTGGSVFTGDERKFTRDGMDDF